jgi:hypothetical protein
MKTVYIVIASEDGIIGCTGSAAKAAKIASDWYAEDYKFCTYCDEDSKTSEDIARKVRRFARDYTGIACTILLVGACIDIHVRQLS